MKCLDQNGVKYLWSLMMGNLQNKSNTGHTHDDRYFTESEINTKLSGYASSNHTHSGYASSNHTHDDRYFTESEINTKLSSKANYEEGTWTPKWIKKDGSVNTLASNASYQKYVRVGNMVYIQARLQNNATKIPLEGIGGLPFTPDGNDFLKNIWVVGRRTANNGGDIIDYMYGRTPDNDGNWFIKRRYYDDSLVCDNWFVAGWYKIA